MLCLALRPVGAHWLVGPYMVVVAREQTTSSHFSLLQGVQLSILLFQVTHPPNMQGNNILKFLTLCFNLVVRQQ